jgi:hypothetical protein
MHRFSRIFLAAVIASATIAGAEVASKSGTIIVVQPQDLPQLAQSAGQSMLLHPLVNGLTYLYVEQQQLGRIAVLDVTDMARIKAIGSVKLETPVAFDFAEQLGDTAILIRYRDGSGSAVMDLRQPKSPVLKPASPLLQTIDSDKIGTSGLLIASVPRSMGESAARDYRIVDSSAPAAPQLLGTVRGVQAEWTKEDTGTVFLLGLDGLTVVRRPAVELQNRLETSYTN